MKQLYRYLFKRGIRENLPPLQRSLTENIDPLELDDDLQLVLMTGRVRDIHEARRLMAKYEVTTGAELLGKLPPRPPVDWRRRFQRWLAQLEGAYEHDPHRDEWRKHKPIDPLRDNGTRLG